MRWITLILFMASCSEKGQDVYVYETDSVLIKSQATTQDVQEAISEADVIIHKEEERIAENIHSLKKELDEAKEVQQKNKLIYIHDTIIIKEKTNFWGRKRVSVDSITFIDSLEYN